MRFSFHGKFLDSIEVCGPARKQHRVENHSFQVLSNQQATNSNHLEPINIYIYIINIPSIMCQISTSEILPRHVRLSRHMDVVHLSFKQLQHPQSANKLSFESFHRQSKKKLSKNITVYCFFSAPRRCSSCGLLY